MTIIVLPHTKHALIRRADVTRNAKRIADAIVDRFDDASTDRALKAAVELDRIDYHPQTAYLIARGNIQALDKVRELI